MHVASSPHDFKLLMQADGRKGTTMDDVASAEAQRNGASATTPPASSDRPAPGAPAAPPVSPLSVG
jgi:hypothetical protein